MELTQLPLRWGRRLGPLHLGRRLGVGDLPVAREVGPKTSCPQDFLQWFGPQDFLPGCFGPLPLLPLDEPVSVHVQRFKEGLSLSVQPRLGEVEEMRLYSGSGWGNVLLVAPWSRLDEFGQVVRDGERGR